MAKIYQSINYGEQGLHSILNMDNLFEGGIKTEFGLYALSCIVEKGGGMYATEALDILDDLSQLNFKELGRQPHIHQANEDIIIDVMWDVADKIAQRDPSLTSLCYQVVKTAEKNSDVESAKHLIKRATNREKFLKNHQTIELQKQGKEHPQAEATKILLAPHIEKRKKEIMDRIEARNKGGTDAKVSGLAVSDELVEVHNQIGTITPEKAKVLSPIIKEAILEKRKHKK